MRYVADIVYRDDRYNEELKSIVFESDNNISAGIYLIEKYGSLSIEDKCCGDRYYTLQSFELFEVNDNSIGSYSK